MCKVCADSVKEFFPEVPDDECGDFLMSCTCFPCCSMLFGITDGSLVRAQLKWLKSKTSNWKECFTIADHELTDSMQGKADFVFENWKDKP